MDCPVVVHPPGAHWTKIAALSHVSVVNHNSNRWPLKSWFVYHKIFMSAITGSLLDVQAAPTDLADGACRSRTGSRRPVSTGPRSLRGAKRAAASGPAG